MTKTNVRELVDNAMIEMIISFPIYAQLIARIGYKVVDNKSIPAAAWTDGKGIYINEPVIQEWNENPIVEDAEGKQYNRKTTKHEIIFILAHEVMHLLGLTFERGNALGLSKYVLNKKDKRLHELWNMATDYEINSLLHNNEAKDDHGYAQSKPIGNLPDVALYESKYRDKTAEEIFEILKKEDEDKKGNSGGGNGDGDEDGEGQGIAPSFDSGNHADGLDSGLDYHAPILDEATQNEVLQKVSEVFGNKSNGTGYSAFDRILNLVYKPEPFNWRRALTKYIRGWMKDNYTWNKPSRAGIANNIILPSSGRSPKMHIGVAIDTSGSIYDTELHTMMNHLFTILQEFKDFKVDVWCCGSKVYKDTFRTYTGSNKKEIANFQFQSDGGNDMRENFKFVKDKYRGDKLDVLIIMSDFIDPLSGDTECTSDCPVIYMCIDNPRFVPPAKIKGQVFPFVVEKQKNG